MSRLVSHGFTQADLDEGWTLLRAVVGDRVRTTAAPRPNTNVLDRLDDWENEWFPIVKATLARHYPKLQLLRHLGFGRPGRPAANAEETEDQPAAGAAPAKPTPTVTN